MRIEGYELINERNNLIVNNQLKIKYINKSNKYYIIHNSNSYKLELDKENNNYLVWTIPKEINNKRIQIQVEVFDKKDNFLFKTNSVNLDINKAQDTIVSASAFGSMDLSDVLNSNDLSSRELLQFDIINRTINMPLNLKDIVVQGDSNSRIIKFKINRFFDNVDLSTKKISILFINANKLSSYDNADILDISEDTLSFTWTISSAALIKYGSLFFQVKFHDINENNNNIYIWQTKPEIINIENGLIIENNAIPRDYSREMELFSEYDDSILYNMIDEHDPFIIENRKIVLPEGKYDIIIQNDNISQLLTFKISRYFDGVDLSEKAIVIAFINANNQGDYAFGINRVTSDDIIEFGWLLDSKVSIKSGLVSFQIMILGYNEKDEFYVWQTLPSQFNVEMGLIINDSEISDLYPTVIQSIIMKLQDLQNQIDNIEITGGGGNERNFYTHPIKLDQEVTGILPINNIDVNLINKINELKTSIENIELRDFLTNPINLSTEVTGIILDSNLPNDLVRENQIEDFVDKNDVQNMIDTKIGTLNYALQARLEGDI